MRHSIGSTAERIRNSPAAKPLVATLLIAGVVRAIALWLPPYVFPDSGGYLYLGYRFWKLRFAGYDGMRTPVYPLFLLFAGGNLYVVRFLQHLLGIAIAAMLFAMVYRRTRSTSFALVAGALYGVDLSQLFLERSILSETVCTFLLTLSAVVFQWIVLGRKFGRREYAILGTLTALTGLTRPIYSYLAPLYFVLIAIEPPRSLRALEARAERVARLTSFAAPAGGLLLGWCLFNWLNIGYFGLSTEIGFSLLNHSGAFIELAPDKYAAIRDPYLKSRALNIAATGSHVNAIFKAEDEILKRTGYSQLQLLRELTRMSLELFAAHPMLYAQGVMRGWLGFWRPRLFRGQPFLGGSLLSAFRGPRSRGGVLERSFAAIGVREIRALAWVNLIFLASTVWIGARFMMRREPWGFDLSAIAIVLAASLSQAMVEFGDASRFSVPTAPLVLYTVIVLSWRVLRTSTASESEHRQA